MQIKNSKPARPRPRPKVVPRADLKPQSDKPISLLGDSLQNELELFEEQPIVRAGALGALSYGLASAYPSTWLHEMGHAKMVELMYDTPKPTVEVFPFKGGVTRWYPGPLTEVGQKFGPDGARAMVSAAGTLVDMGVATTTFGAGFKLRKKHPMIGAALMGYGAMTVANSIAYAASAVGKDVVKLAREGNDFAGLAVRAGLHPLASVAIMASILPLEYAALKWLENRSNGS